MALKLIGPVVAGLGRADRQRICAELSDPPDHHGDPVRGRRPDRRARPGDGGQNERAAGQQVVVENVTGAGGQTGSKRVARRASPTATTS